MSYLPYLALGGRILLLGIERIAIKRLSTDAESSAVSAIYFFIGAVLMLPFAFGEAIGDFSFMPLLFAAGVIYSVAFVFYVRSLAEGDASLVSPLYNFNVVFLAGLAWLFLGEKLTIIKVSGLLLLLYGASWLKGGRTIFSSFRNLFNDRACLYMIAASLLIALGRLIDKTMMSSVPPVIYACILSLMIAALTFLHLLLQGKASSVVKIMKERSALAVACGAINGYSYLCLLFAMKSIEVSVVEPVSMLGIIVTLLLSKAMLRERLGNRVPAALIMIAGAWLLLSF